MRKITIKKSGPKRMIEITRKSPNPKGKTMQYKQSGIAARSKSTKKA